MKKSSIKELKEKLNTGSNLKIAIIDNNIMQFLVNLKKEIDVLPLFEIYDMILIPKWVEEEINDGQTRIDCLNYIATEKDVYIIDEKDYSYLANYKDLELILLFQSSTLCMGEVKGKIRKYIAQSSNKEELEYDEFIDELYNNILKDTEIDLQKRAKRKNAGEISICVLSYLLGFYYEDIENIAVFTFDKDCYDYIKRAKEDLYDSDKIVGLINTFKSKDSNAITFKSNDLILKQLYDLDEVKGIEIINKVRKNPRSIKYSIKKNDGSIEENKKVIDTVNFVELIKYRDIHLIF